MFASELSSVEENPWLVPLLLDVLQALAFAALAVWCRHRPLWATLAALLLYVGVHGLMYFLGSEQAGEGWILKIVFLALLTWCIVNGWKYERLQRAS
jgi:hypothetical protein